MCPFGLAYIQFLNINSWVFENFICIFLKNKIKKMTEQEKEEIKQLMKEVIAEELKPLFDKVFPCTQENIDEIKNNVDFSFTMSELQHALGRVGSTVDLNALNKSAIGRISDYVKSTNCLT
jgi:uncharacterized protein YjgD (DUF1641 family)